MTVCVCVCVCTSTFTCHACVGKKKTEGEKTNEVGGGCEVNERWWNEEA